VTNNELDGILARYHVNVATEKSFEEIVRGKYNKDFYFVQIGANNGVRYDPIHELVKELNLTGLAIEPIKEYYDELVVNYADYNVTTVNRAIYSENTKISMFKVHENANVPEWTRGIASFDKDFYRKSNTGLQSVITEEVVNTITFDDLLKDYSVDRITLLQMDAEGYDYNLLKMFPFDKFQPDVVHFEHGLPNNNMSIAQFEEIVKMLSNYGYNILLEYYDCIAYK